MAEFKGPLKLQASQATSFYHIQCRPNVTRLTKAMLSLAGSRLLEKIVFELIAVMGSAVVATRGHPAAATQGSIIPRYTARSPHGLPHAPPRICREVGRVGQR